jgi:hypothetical protein
VVVTGLDVRTPPGRYVLAGPDTAPRARVRLPRPIGHDEGMRLACAVALLALVLGGAACGGDGDEPALNPAVAEELAARSDAVADLLAAGEACSAEEEAQALARAVEGAAADGRVPPELSGELARAVADLQARIECEQAEPASPEAPPPPPADEEEQPEPQEEEERPEPEPEAPDACADLELRLQQIEDELATLGDVLEDKDERREREDALKEERKAVREALKECERPGN